MAANALAAALGPRLLPMPYSEAYRSLTLGIDNRNGFKQRVLDRVDAGERDFVLDLRAATYIDAHGLGVLVSLTKTIRALDGSFVLLGPNEDLVTLFEITRLDTVLTVCAVDEWIRCGGTL